VNAVDVAASVNVQQHAMNKFLIKILVGCKMIVGPKNQMKPDLKYLET